MNKFMVVAVIIGLISSAAVFFLTNDADLLLRFYEKIGPEPCSVLQGKVVWVTGASSGIGEQLAYDLVSCGCKVVLSARRENKLLRVKEKCLEIIKTQHRSIGEDERILVLPLDVTLFSSHVNLTSQVIKKFGHIDILINNAGVSQMPVTWPEEIPFGVEKQLLDINLLGALSLSKAVIPGMIERKQGKIVLVGSIFGKMAAPGFAAYCASKSALMMYFDAIRYELYWSNIRIVHVLPGPVKSDILDNALTDTVNVTAKDHSGFSQFKSLFSYVRFMETKRCTYLILVAMVNNIKESWLAPIEMLLLVYVAHYLRII